MEHDLNDISTTTHPMVSIGMPLYNNARTIERAINSIRAQTWKNIEIIISDDGSSDDTFLICKRLAQEDERIRIFRQDRNLYYQNFHFLLKSAKADYFMWAAGDDYWRPAYVKSNVEVLLKSPDVAGSVSRCLFHQNGRSLRLAAGTYSLMNDPSSNIESFLRNPTDNTRMYGVFRRSILLKSFPKRNFHAYDWAISATTLLYGKHYQIESILMRRDETPPENYNYSVNRDHQSTTFRYFPVLRMSLHLIFVSRIPITAGIFKALIKLNYIKHENYVETCRPLLFRRVIPFYRAFRKYLLWRL